jgi:hypothetical protein
MRTCLISKRASLMLFAKRCVDVSDRDFLLQTRNSHQKHATGTWPPHWGDIKMKQLSLRGRDLDIGVTVIPEGMWPRHWGGIKMQRLSLKTTLFSRKKSRDVANDLHTNTYMQMHIHTNWPADLEEDHVMLDGRVRDRVAVIETHTDIHNLCMHACVQEKLTCWCGRKSYGR